MHSVRFPGESAEYRARRDSLLQAEIELRRSIETVAAKRRELPIGGEIPTDYEFSERGGKKVKLSALFAPGKNTLVIYSFMYGPEMKSACPSCTSILDGMDGQSDHVTQRVNFVVVAKSPIDRILAHAETRGWRKLRLLSSENTTYNRDYQGENAKGNQMPVLNVFVKRGDKVFHTYSTELLFVPPESGQNGRHVDQIWPLWNLFDYTPDGRGADWHPKLSY